MSEVKTKQNGIKNNKMAKKKKNKWIKFNNIFLIRLK